MEKKQVIIATLTGVFILLICAIIMLSWVPPISRDALTHHLAIPKLYLKHGGIYEITDRPFSYYPMNLDFLYLIPLNFGNDIIPKHIHFAFALLTTYLIFKYLKKNTNTTLGILGAFFFLSLPIIVKLSITVYVDLGLIFFTTASLLAMLKWLETGLRIRWLVLSGVMCGLGLGTKYNGLISLLVLASLIPILYLRNRTPYKKQMKALCCGIFFLTISLFVFSPWLIRNYTWTKNPIHPLYSHWFQKELTADYPLTTDKDQETSIDNLRSFALRKIIFGEKWWEILLIPIRIFFQGEDDNPKYFDGELNPLLILFPGLAFLKRRKEESDIIKLEKKVFIIFSILFLLFAFFQNDMRIRYIAPILPPLVILSILGLHDMASFATQMSNPISNNILKSFIYGSTILYLSINSYYILKQFKQVNPIPYIAGKVSRENYIERIRPEYHVIQYANRNLSEDDKILVLFLGERGYYFDKNAFFGYEWLKNQIHKANSAEYLLVAFRKKEITHLFVRNDILDGWVGEDLRANVGKNLVSFINSHTKLMITHSGYSLYKISY
ncbi:MAG: hypothetical protein A2V65_09820 [Deltaproteobacteria bacterium RBG_13_49_15]|nr:MAG: hypothetical protein A2V65_09820 [Deltaproteobacteria bacterium RBG_13_49_15]